ncbi:cytosolic sulfotransferase 15-like [Salvia miltiorrhiza]|uniref:cytosolic sulfotransferase 15-like n=1 Tax=Salvia miltiorrhiza TaxID=226208 RepID=UPI0025ABA68E|nr:cytosolic sulfotransferase 15-like [Salvia miltiorrhiza]
MGITKILENQPNTRSPAELDEVTQECRELLITLPKERGWRTSNIYLYQKFWCQPKEIEAIISMQKHYIAEDSDIIVSTIPKSGTTWLKALCFAVANRCLYAGHNTTHPLLTFNSHMLVPFLEYKLFANQEIPDMSRLPRPHLVGTHVPVGALPDSVRESQCKIVYMVRNPFDTFVSIWHFMSKLRPDSMGPLSFQEVFDMYCRGTIGFGPYWDHMLGYWHESLRNPNKVLFLRYEEMKENAGFHLRKLANFLGFPFSAEEEEDGVVDEIIKMCSFEQMKELDVNKKGKGAIVDFENKNLFRKGVVGDWMNHFSPEMVERLSKIMEEKLAGSGLSFKIN